MSRAPVAAIPIALVPVPVAAILIALALVPVPATAATPASASTAATPAPAPTPAPSGPHDATAHEPFTGIQKWVRIFDDPGRDAWQKPSEVATALGLRPGMVVADLGAGTGYFEPALARAIGPTGMVLAIDTEPEMIQHLRQRILREKLGSVLPVLADPADPFLPAGRVDRVLIVDTYHHIDDRLAYFARIREALAPGGRVAIVDYYKKPLPVGPPPHHKLAREFVLQEMTRAGWSLAGEPTFLPYQYFLIFAPAPH